MKCPEKCKILDKIRFLSKKFSRQQIQNIMSEDVVCQVRFQDYIYKTFSCQRFHTNVQKQFERVIADVTKHQSLHIFSSIFEHRNKTIHTLLLLQNTFPYSFQSINSTDFTKLSRNISHKNFPTGNTFHCGTTVKRRLQMHQSQYNLDSSKAGCRLRQCMRCRKHYIITPHYTITQLIPQIAPVY